MESNHQAFLHQAARPFRHSVRSPCMSARRGAGGFAAAALLCSALYGAAAHGEVYRCDAGGVVSYADRPCAAGTQSTMGGKSKPALEPIAVARSRVQTSLDARPAKAKSGAQSAGADCPRAVEIVQILTLAPTWAAPGAAEAPAQVAAR